MAEAWREFRDLVRSLGWIAWSALGVGLLCAVNLGVLFVVESKETGFSRLFEILIWPGFGLIFFLFLFIGSLLIIFLRFKDIGNKFFISFSSAFLLVFIFGAVFSNGSFLIYEITAKIIDSFIGIFT